MPLLAQAKSISFGTPLGITNGPSLPFRSSGFYGDELRLTGGTVPGATLVIDISDPMAPGLTRYTTELQTEEL